MKCTIAVAVTVYALLIFCGNAGAREPDLEISQLLECIEFASKHRDGALGNSIDGAIIEIININTRISFSWLEKKEEIKNTLFSRWQYTVFTDHEGIPQSIKKLKNFKSKLESTVKKFKPTTDGEKKLKKRMLEELKKIKIRVID